MNKFIIYPNSFLKKKIQGYYHTDYFRMEKQNNPDYLNRLKNDKSDFSIFQLENDKNIVRDILVHDLEEIISILTKYTQRAISESLFSDDSYSSDDYDWGLTEDEKHAGLEYILSGSDWDYTNIFDDDSEPDIDIVTEIAFCVVPRAKANMMENQLYFKKAVIEAIGIINQRMYLLIVDYRAFYLSLHPNLVEIVRHTDMQTTHLKNTNYNNTGSAPYPGITKNTCSIFDDIKNKHIILIDDIYTKTVNIDEDVIQTLLDNGAKDVIFYAVANTVKE